MISLGKDERKKEVGGCMSLKGLQCFTITYYNVRAYVNKYKFNNKLLNAFKKLYN